MGNRIDRWRAEGIDEYAIQHTLRYEKQQREFWKGVRETENRDTLEKARNKLKETIWKIRNLAFDGFWCLARDLFQIIELRVLYL